MKTICVAILCSLFATMAVAKLKESDFDHVGTVINTNQPLTDQDVSIAGRNCIVTEDYFSCATGTYPQTWMLRLEDGYTVQIQFRADLLTQDFIDPILFHEKNSTWASFPTRYRMWCERHRGQFSVYVGIPVYEKGKLKRMALYDAWYPASNAKACPLDHTQVSPEQQAITSKANACYAKGMGADFKTGECVPWK